MDEFEFFFDKEWSDGLPVVTPTEERIGLMLSGTAREPGEVLGQVAPAGGDLSIQSVAAHAVMAGCKPEYMPVLIAGLEALLDERFNVNLNSGHNERGRSFSVGQWPLRQGNRATWRCGLYGPRFSREFDHWPRREGSS